MNNGLQIKHPTVQEVINFNKISIVPELQGNNYNSLISIFLTYPVDFIVELYDAGFPDYEVFSQYDIFVMLYGLNEALYIELIKFFLGDINLSVAQNTSTGEKVLYDSEKDFVFDLTSFMVMSNFIKTIHHIPEDKSKTAKKSKALKMALVETERVNKVLREQIRQQEKMSGKSEQGFQKLITKLTISSRFTRNELSSMKLFEFYEILNEVVEFNYWKFKMSGVYSGNIDTKKMNKKELEWFFN